MESRVEEIGPCRRKLTVTVPAAEIKTAIEKSYGELRRTVTIPGFRRGKAPRAVLEKRFASHVMEDVKRDIVVGGIEDGIRTHSLEVVSDPDFGDDGIDIKTDQDLEFSFSVEIKPDFDLPSLDGIEVTKSQKAVTDQDLDEILERLRNENASWVPVEAGGAKEGDLVIGAMQFMDGETEAFKRDQAHLHIGEDKKIAGALLDEGSLGFVGKKSGDEHQAPVTIPDDHSITALRGRKLTMHFQIEEVKRMELPEINDELAEQFGLDSLAAMKTKIRSDLEENARQEAVHEVEEAILNQLIARVEIPLPETTVNRTLDAQSRDVLMRQVMSGQIGTDDIPGTLQKIRDELRPEAEHSIRAWYLMQKIAKREKIFATENEVGQRIEAMAMQKGTTPTKIREELAEKDALDQVRTAVLEQKVRNWLTEQVKIVEETGGSADAGAQG